MMKPLNLEEIKTVTGAADGYLQQLSEWIPYILSHESCKRLAKLPVVANNLRGNQALDFAFPILCFLGAKTVGYLSKQAASLLVPHGNNTKNPKGL